MALHAHVSIESAGCDGSYSRTYVIGPNVFPGDEWDYRAGLIGNALAFSDAHTTVAFTDSGFTVDTPTDEGYVHTEYEWCEEGDTDTPNTFRDYRAESMGY